MWLEIILFILGIIILIIYGIIKLKTNKDVKKIDVTANQPICFNLCRRDFTEGYCLGVTKTQLPRKNKTTLFEFYPLDVEQGEDIPRPKLKSVVVKDEYIKRFAKGELSSTREIIFLISRNPIDYPDKMNETIEGGWMKKEGQLGFLKSLLGEAIPQTSASMKAIMNEFAGGEMTAVEIARMREVNQKYREMSLGNENQEKMDKTPK